MSDQSQRWPRAGEYVLGLLEGADLAAAEASVREDPMFRQAVEEFAARMSPLDLTAKPEPVPGGLWDAIAASIADMPQEATEPAADRRVVPFPSPQARGQTWRPLALAASLLVGIGLGYAGGWLTNRAPAPVVFVVLQTPQDRPGAVFEAFSDNSVRILPLQDFPVPAGQVLQVWTLYDQAVGPVSLGTLPRAEISTLGEQPFPVPAAGQLYEITLEPAPGSPTGKPTGPILVKGFAQRQDM